MNINIAMVAPIIKILVCKLFGVFDEFENVSEYGSWSSAPKLGTYYILIFVIQTLKVI